MNDLVFAGWDIFPDNAYQAASNAGVLSLQDLEKVKPFLSAIKPMKAAFDQNYVKKLDGPNIKKGKNKYELALQIKEDIAEFQEDQQSFAPGDVLVRLDGNFSEAGGSALDAGKVRGGDEGESSGDCAVDVVRLGGDYQRACHSPTARRT